jgi:hypothetical protein
MVTIAAALGWLGWRLLEQDRDLSRQRIQERLEGAADLASAMLVRKLMEVESMLTMPAAEPKSNDALTVVLADVSTRIPPPVCRTTRPRRRFTTLRRACLSRARRRNSRSTTMRKR